MFTSIVIILLPLLVIAFLPLILKSFFSAAELDEMGICDEESEMMSSDSFQELDRDGSRMTATCANA